MSQIFRQMQPRKGKSLVRRLSPSKFITVLKSKQQQFEGTQQQDAHELFSVLLNTCDDEAKLLFDLPAGHRSFIQDVFQGELSSEIRCLTCERVSFRKETFVDLSLDVENCCSVTQCLQSFTSVETMNGSNKFMCEACNGLQEAHRRCRVRRWPRCLLLQLKRFKVVESGGAYFNKKLNARVEFSREIRLTGTAAADDECDGGVAGGVTSSVSGSDMLYVFLALRLTVFCIFYVLKASAAPCELSFWVRYSLIGAVVHSGSGANFGHYVAVANVRVSIDFCFFLFFTPGASVVATHSRRRFTMGHVRRRSRFVI
jgi:ubiquitin C-terminal hydrolase